MLLLFKTFRSVVASILRSRAAVELENLALRHQIGVLQRSAAKRPKLTSGDRPFWICLSRLWCDWRSTLAIIMPETVARPHDASEKNQSRRTRRGSVRLARHAGNRQANMAVVVMAAKARLNTIGSYGLTL